MSRNITFPFVALITTLFVLITGYVIHSNLSSINRYFDEEEEFEEEN